MVDECDVFTLFGEAIQKQGLTTYDDIKRVFSAPPYCLKFKHDASLGLYLVSFTDASDLTLPLVRECNGMIYRLDSLCQPVCRVLPKCYDGIQGITDATMEKEWEGKQPDLFDAERLNRDLSGGGGEFVMMRKYTDGAMLKMYWHQEAWHWATSRHLDAKQNRWGKVTFQHIIDSTPFPSHVITHLNPQFSYHFVLTHPSLSVCGGVPEEEEQHHNVPPRCTLIPLYYIHTASGTYHRYVSVPPSLPILCGVEDLPGMTENGDSWILYRDEADAVPGYQIRLLSPRMQRLKCIRGNHPDIGMVYIKYLAENDLQKKDELVAGFPLFKGYFATIDAALKDASEYLHSVYFQKFVKHEYVDVDYTTFSMILELHRKYLNTKIVNTIPRIRHLLCEICMYRTKMVRRILGC